MAKSKKHNIKTHEGDKKSLPEDTQWCLSNLRNLTTRKSYDVFGHEYNSVQNISRRYKNIMNNELKGAKNIVNIRNEHNIWIKSKKNTNYWLEKIRVETVSNTHIEGGQYVQEDVRAMDNSQNQEKDAQTDKTDGEATEYHEDEQNKIKETEEDESVEVEPWIMENGINVTTLFTEYYKRVEQFFKTEGLIPIEIHVQELSALNHILILKPLQHSKMIRKFDELTQLNLILKRLINQTQSVHNIATNLRVFSNSLDYEKRRVIIGIAILVIKLPKDPIVDITTISESELWSIYFDPFLSAIISDNERNTLLRWLNKQAENDLLRPDASLTTINQLQFGFNLGFGEVKISQPTCDKAALCNDVLRLTHLTKEYLDNHRLDASLSFQIHGFSVSFYMTQLPCHKLYTTAELGKVSFSKSLKDISAFCCPQNLQFLIQVTNAFWSHCKPSLSPSVIKESSSRSVNINLLYEFVDPHKSRKRTCHDFFG
ncbi:uncharacterized protein EV154DRAFT_527502 [Mucor mucedo]|uniref:uncharacterized protein n=1 Tax=Mucor mucedo TaxID=29922 RepID=UPI00221FCF7F|nr:uncharacterized protein EV154DRAFT_527502 [Mucor mucedo]KAI7874007.1 hypothetical protein EV154DRAFT_527502 [Mucor mucedo]